MMTAMTSAMRRTMVGLLSSALFVASLGFVPCCVGMPAAPAQVHGCCAPAAGMKAAAPDCCRTTATDPALTAVAPGASSLSTPPLSVAPAIAATHALPAPECIGAGFSPPPLTILRI
jgi:hypothetical protein